MLPFLPALITGGMNLIGDMVSQTNARSAFKHRYQDTVNDQRAAGLNPALAYGQGGGNPQTADFGDIGSGAAQGQQAYANAKQASASTRLTTAQAKLLENQSEDLALTTAYRRAQANFAQQNEDTRGQIMRLKEGNLRNLSPDIIKRYRQGTQLQGLQLPQARAYAKYYAGPYGQKEPYMQSARDWADAAAKWAKGGNTTNIYRR